MAGKQQGIRWDDWIIPAVEAFGKENGLEDFSKSIKFLVRTALNHYGYFEDAYKPGIKDMWQEPQSHIEKSKNDGRRALLFIDRMKALMDNKSWGKDIIAQFGRQQGVRTFEGNGTRLLEAIKSAVKTSGYDPDTLLVAEDAGQKKEIQEADSKPIIENIS